MLNGALESKRESRKKYHNTNVDTVLLELNQLEDKFSNDEQDSYEERSTQIFSDDIIIIGDSPLLQCSSSPVLFRSPIPLSPLGESHNVHPSAQSIHTQQSSQGIVHYNPLLQLHRTNNYPFPTTPQSNPQSDVFGEGTVAHLLTSSLPQSVVTGQSTVAPPSRLCFGYLPCEDARKSLAIKNVIVL